MKNPQNRKTKEKGLAKDQATGPTIPLTNPRPKQGQQFIHQEIFNGPLPPPTILAGYRNIDPTLPERIIKEFEENSAHIREMEKLSTQSKIDSDKRGQYMAFALTIFLLLVVLLALYLGNITFAGVGFLAFFSFIITSFVKKPQNKDKTKEPIE